MDNVAELLHAITPDQRGSTAGKRLLKLFDAQEPALEQAMAQKGLHRWGAAWLSDAQMADVRQKQEDLKKQLAGLQGQFDDVQAEIRRIEDDIDSNMRSMRQLEAGRYVRDENGNLYKKPLPSVYYDMQADNRKLETRRQEAMAHRAQIQTAARTVASQAQDGLYTGEQKLIGVEGTPVLLRAPASTQPSTTPSSKPSTTRP
jgi:septal ring factor EnvC (AmiA/AmiB activator)